MPVEMEVEAGLGRRLKGKVEKGVNAQGNPVGFNAQIPSDLKKFEGTPNLRGRQNGQVYSNSSWRGYA
jgi:hypothetical protein